MADWIDEAQALQQRLTDAAIDAARAGLAGDGSDACIGCGAPIPAARRAALPSAERCVGCQGLLERGMA